MPIFGVTVGEQGEVMQRLAVSTKVAIGEVKKAANGKTYPSKLDHFIFLRKGDQLAWEQDADLTKHFGTECREFWIVLMDDILENVFRTEYAWWSASEKKCWGDGRQATRRTQKAPDGEEWTPCGDECSDLQSGQCKPSGDLYFVLADFPRLGAVCRLHTSSYRSIRQVHSALEQIRTVTGGRLAGIRCKLVVRPEKTSFIDKDGKKKPTTIYALNLEVSADDMRKLLSSMTEHAQLFEQTQRLLGAGRTVEITEEDEPERASEIAHEFYPEPDAQPAPVIAQPARVSAALPVEAKPVNGNSHTNGHFITDEQRRELFKIITEAGWGTDQAKNILYEKWGVATSKEIPVDKYEEICKRFASGTMSEPYEAKDEDIPW